MEVDEAYATGLRDGRIDTLERQVKEITEDVKRLKTACYMLYGAILLVQFLPKLQEVI